MISMDDVKERSSAFTKSDSLLYLILCVLIHICDDMNRREYDEWTRRNG